MTRRSVRRPILAPRRAGRNTFQRIDATSDPVPPSWHSVATRRTVVHRALTYAVVVGAVLITINHGDAILRGEVDGSRLARMVLTMFVPYVVSTLSSVGAIRARH